MGNVVVIYDNFKWSSCTTIIWGWPNFDHSLVLTITDTTSDTTRLTNFGDLRSTGTTLRVMVTRVTFFTEFLVIFMGNVVVIYDNFKWSSCTTIIWGWLNFDHSLVLTITDTTSDTTRLTNFGDLHSTGITLRVMVTRVTFFTEFLDSSHNQWFEARVRVIFTKYLSLQSMIL